MTSSRRCKGMDPRHPIINTSFLLRCLVDSIAIFTRDSSTITSLTLDGIPLRLKYLNILCSGLKNNVTLSKLVLSRCRIGDNGCDLLLGCLRNNPKLCVLNLSSCQLTSRCARCIALFLKRRKADMLQNVWEQSSQPSAEGDYDKKSRGLHTLILNQNPKFGDNGLRNLFQALRNDEWLTLLSLRHCGITKEGAEIMIRVLYLNNVITKLDLTENRIPINTLQKVLKMLKRRREAVGDGITLKKMLHLRWRRNMLKDIQGCVKKGDERNLNKKKCQLKRTKKLKKRKRRQGKDSQEVKEDICRTKKLSDLELQLFNLLNSNFQLKEELSSNKALLNQETECRYKMEDEMQKMALRLSDMKGKVVELNCLSSKASSESQLLMGLKYIFDKLESLSTLKMSNTTIEEEVILNEMEPLWSPTLTQQRGNSFMNCLQRRPYCPPLKI